MSKGVCHVISRYSIYKVHSLAGPLSRDSLLSISDVPPFVKNFFQVFSTFFKLFQTSSAHLLFSHPVSRALRYNSTAACCCQVLFSAFPDLFSHRLISLSCIHIIISRINSIYQGNRFTLISSAIIPNKGGIKQVPRYALAI